MNMECRNEGGQGWTSAPGRSTLGRQIEVGMLRTNYRPAIRPGLAGTVPV